MSPKVAESGAAKSTQRLAWEVKDKATETTGRKKQKNPASL